jgi:hypothetical protein
MPGRFTVTKAPSPKAKTPSPKAKTPSPKKRKSTVVHMSLGYKIGTPLTQKEFNNLGKKITEQAKMKKKQLFEINIPKSVREAKAKRTLKNAYKKTKATLSAKSVAKKWLNKTRQTKKQSSLRKSKALKNAMNRQLSLFSAK